MNCSPPSSSVHGILQARVLEWVAIFYSSRSTQPWDRTRVSIIAGKFFTVWAMRIGIRLLTKSPWIGTHSFEVISPLCPHLPGKATKLFFSVWVCGCLVTLSCPTLCDLMGCSPPGSSVHRIFRQDYWTRLPFPTPGAFPNSGTEPMSLASPALAEGYFFFLPLAPPGKPFTKILSLRFDLAPEYRDHISASVPMGNRLHTHGVIQGLITWLFIKMWAELRKFNRNGEAPWS